MCIQLNYFLYSVVLDEVFRIDESSKKKKLKGVLHLRVLPHSSSKI